MVRRKKTETVATQTTNVVAEEKETKMGFVVDLAGVSTSNVVDEGTYIVNLTKATLRDTANGNKRVMVEFTINDDEAQDMNGRKVFMNYTLVKESFWALKRDLLALGADEEVLEGQFDVMQMFDSLKGAKVYALVSVDTNPKTNQPINRVQIKSMEDGF